MQSADPTTAAVTVESNLDLAVIVFGLVVYLQLCIFFCNFVKKFSLRAVFKTVDVNQARTLDLLRCGIRVIPIAEQKTLFSRYCKLAELRDAIAAYRLHLVPGLHGEVCGWLKDIQALREAAEATFEEYESEDIARDIARVLNGGVNKLV